MARFTQPRQILRDGDLGVWGPGFGFESARTNSFEGCKDGNVTTADPYPYINNCPMDTAPYVIGGPGTIWRDYSLATE